MNSTLRIVAPAKVNLFLHITGKRADGYHLLDSLVVFTDFGDTLEITPAEQLQLTVTGPFATTLGGDDNFVLRAARLLQERTGCHKGAQITLHKHIPVGAGLGGGSSDAASALLGLMQLWGVTLAPEALQSLALQLGSDVPACLLRKPALLRGIGEQITPVGYPEENGLVLVNPGVPLLTADVYRTFSGPFSPPSSGESIQSHHNALEPPAKALLPVIGDIIAAIAATPGCTLVRMSGSGATCFGMYADGATAQQAALDLQRLHPHWWVQQTTWYADNEVVIPAKAGIL